VTLRRFKAREVLFKEGEVGDSLFVLRSGGVALSRGKGSEQILVSEVRSGHLVGEMALMGDPVRRETRDGHRCRRRHRNQTQGIPRARAS
jgi:CRP-like cAMP-binding protein